MRNEPPLDAAPTPTPRRHAGSGVPGRAIRAPHTLAAAGVAVFFVLLTSACGGGSPSSTTAAPVPYDGAVVVAGATQNTPVPTLSDNARTTLTALMLAGRPVDVVKISGVPDLLATDDLGLEAIAAGRGTPSGNQAAAEDNLSAVSKAITSAPNADGASYLEALFMAADKAAARGARAPYVVLIGSGLDDQGAMSFVTPGMLGADPAEVVAQLQADGTFANADRLAGVTVVLSGFGYSSAPQAPLTDSQRASVIAIWTAGLQAMGATVIVDPDVRTGPSVTTDFTVVPVVVPVTPPVAVAATCTTQEYAFDGQSDVTFIPRTAVFADPGAARSALDPLAAWLVARPGRTAVIRGTTANDGSTTDVLRATGKARAQTVADYLVSRGVDPRQLEVVGVGSAFPEYVMPDRDPTTHALLAGPAVLNRSVRVALTDPC